MHKIFAVACVCLLMGGEAAVKKAPDPCEVPYDADLFSRDRQVYSLHAEFLFWRIQEGALDYALKMEQPAWSTEHTSFAQGKFETATYNGDPGFRIMASFFRAPKYWEIWGSYTRLTAQGENEVAKPNASALFLTPTWPQISNTSATLARAKSWIHFNYNTAELLVDRFFNPNPHLRLRLIGGGLVTWMSQNWKIEYYDASRALTKIRSQWNYTAGGVRTGVMADWFWGYDIYLTTLATLGLTIGTYENKTTQFTNVTPIGDGDPSLPIGKSKYCDVRPAFTAQIQIGPCWQKSFTNTRWELFAGYELNTWLNLHEVYRSDAALPEAAKPTWIDTSALALQGLTTRLSVDF